MGLNDPDLVRTITEGAFDAYRWSVDHLGIDYLDRVDLFGGHSVPRGLTPVKHTGDVFIKHLLGKLKDTGT